MATKYTLVEYLDYNLCYNKEFKILICREPECKTIINSNKSSNIILEHLVSKHKYSRENRDLKAYIKKLKDLELLSLNNIITPSNFLYLFRDLEKEKPGFLCLIENCNYITSNKRNILQHLNTSHNIYNKYKDKNIENLYTSNIYIQSLSKKKDLSKYFITSNSIYNPLLESNKTNSNIIKEYKKAIEDEQNNFIINYNNLEQREIPTIIKKTYFYKFLSNKDLSSLLKLVIIPIEKALTIEELEDNILFKEIINTCYSIETLVSKFSRRHKQ
jgi:hypothetical protein